MANDSPLDHQQAATVQAATVQAATVLAEILHDVAVVMLTARLTDGSLRSMPMARARSCRRIRR